MHAFSFVSRHPPSAETQASCQHDVLPTWIFIRLIVGVAAGCLQGKRVLELGSGTGLVGIVAACLGAEVQLTDLAVAMPLLKLNMGVNQHLVEPSGGSMSCSVLEWQEPLSSLHGQPWDIVIGSDLVYNAASVPQLTGALQQLIQSEHHWSLLLAHKHRTDAVDRCMLDAMSNCGMRLAALAEGRGEACNLSIYQYGWSPI